MKISDEEKTIQRLEQSKKGRSEIGIKNIDKVIKFIRIKNGISNKGGKRGKRKKD